MRVVRDLGRGADGFEFFLAHELITFHRHGNFEFGNIRRYQRLHTAQYFSQTPDSYRRIAARQRNQIFDAAADFNFGRGQETDAARADIACLFGPIHSLIAHLNNMQGKLQSVPLSTSLFQDPYTLLIFPK